MQLHQLKPTHRGRKRKRVGRGGKRGTYSGRGIKGQKARAGRKLKPAIRIFIKRYPKLRGYRFRRKGLKSEVLNIGVLEKNFKDNETVNPQILLKRRLIRRIKGKVPKVKILGKGNLSKKLTIEGCNFSKTAQEKIKKIGGKIVI